MTERKLSPENGPLDDRARACGTGFLIAEQELNSREQIFWRTDLFKTKAHWIIFFISKHEIRQLDRFLLMKERNLSPENWTQDLNVIDPVVGRRGFPISVVRVYCNPCDLLSWARTLMPSEYSTLRVLDSVIEIPMRRRSLQRLIIDFVKRVL